MSESGSQVPVIQAVTQRMIPDRWRSLTQPLISGHAFTHQSRVLGLW